jgi:hypothetical protein
MPRLTTDPALDDLILKEVVRRLEEDGRWLGLAWLSFETRAPHSSFRRLRKLVCACALLRTRSIDAWI